MSSVSNRRKARRKPGASAAAAAACRPPPTAPFFFSPRRSLKGKQPPEGWELIEEVVEDFEQQMKDAVNEDTAGKRRNETTWKVRPLPHARRGAGTPVRGPAAHCCGPTLRGRTDTVAPCLLMSSSKRLLQLAQAPRKGRPPRSPPMIFPRSLRPPSADHAHPLGEEPLHLRPHVQPQGAPPAPAGGAGRHACLPGRAP